MTAEPRDVEEIRADVEAMTGRNMGESLSAAHRLTDDVAPLLARLAAADRENAELRGEVERLREWRGSQAETMSQRVDEARAQLTAAFAQLAEAQQRRTAAVRAVMDRGDAFAELYAERDQLRARLEAVRAVRAEMHQTGVSLLMHWSDILDAALSAAPQPEPETKTAAQLLREIAKRDPDGHKAALGRAYGLGRDPAHYPDPEGAN